MSIDFNDIDNAAKVIGEKLSNLIEKHKVDIWPATPDEVLENGDISVVLYAFGHRSSGNVYKQICEMSKKNYPCVKQTVKLSNLLR